MQVLVLGLWLTSYALFCIKNKRVSDFELSPLVRRQADNKVTILKLLLSFSLNKHAKKTYFFGFFSKHEIVFCHLPLLLSKQLCALAQLQYKLLSNSFQILKMSITNHFKNKDFDDFFLGVYESPYVTWLLLVCYIICLIACLSLNFVIWFERSGMAGHYRTLVNQLTSFNPDQV